MSKPRYHCTDTCRFSIGHDLTNAAQPVLFQLEISGPKGRVVLPTTWSPEVAEGMAYGLLKHVELVRRKRAQLLAPADSPQKQQ